MRGKHYKLSRPALSNLLGSKSRSTAVSIYMSPHLDSQPFDPKTARLIFKNLWDSTARHNLSKQFKLMFDDLNFWEHQPRGLAILATDNDLTALDLPVTCEEFAVSSQELYLAPLMGLMDFIQPYFVLKVARKHPQLFRGDMYSLEPVEAGLPESVEAALGIDEWKEGNVQFHSVSGSASAEWHSQGGAKNRGDEELKFYLRVIDKAVRKKLPAQATLMLAGTDEMAEEYRAVSHYSNILPGHIADNHNSNDFLSKSQAKMLTDVIRPRHGRLASAFRQLEGEAPPRASSSLPALKDAAERGSIKALLVGLLDFENQTQSKLLKTDANEAEQINHLSLQTWHTSGEVIAVERKLLAPNTMAALLRY